MEKTALRLLLAPLIGVILGIVTLVAAHIYPPLLAWVPRDAPRVIRARAFEVIDSKGKVAARLGDTEEGSGIHFFNENGILQSSLALGYLDEPYMVFRDDRGADRIYTGRTGVDFVTLDIISSNSFRVVSCGIDASGVPAMGVNAAGVKQGSIEMRPWEKDQSSASLQISDRHGNIRGGLVYKEGKGSSLVANGKSYGTMSFNLFDSTGPACVVSDYFTRKLHVFPDKMPKDL